MVNENIKEIDKHIDTFTKWKILRDIAMNNFKDEKIAKKKIAQTIGISHSNPYFCKVIDALIDLGGIDHIETIGRIKFLKVNKEKCIDLAYECRIFKYFEELVDSVNKLWYKI